MIILCIFQMSVSTLESLPNEILVEIIEKYINGVDLINAFAFQLNRRFDALIIHSRRLRFNFTKCHKDDFRVCLGLLPAYANKIEQLALAEQFTPGQIHAFLTFYPSFGMFPRLQQLYLQVDIQRVDRMILENAVHSLLNTALHTLTINISACNSLSLQSAMRDLFYIKSLRKFSSDFYFPEGHWMSLRDASSNIQYLTLQNTFCERADLQQIFRCAPDLRYLSVGIDSFAYYRDEKLNWLDNNSLVQMPMLHTAVFRVRRSDESFRKQLQMSFKCMSSLRHLDIKIQDKSANMDMWEALIQTSLPSLNSFLLEISLVRVTDMKIFDILAITDTPFWNKQERFNFIIKDLLETGGRRFKTMTRYQLDPDTGDSTIFRWDTKPLMNNDSIVSNRISKLYLFPGSHSLAQYYYLNNVTHLFIDNLNSSLLAYIMTYINCSRIQHLDVSSTTERNLIFPLVQSATNVRSLRINLKQLHDELDGHQMIYPTVQSLDISSDQHSFSENVLFMIRRMFPHLQHLVIFTKDLDNVPMIETYLPRLRSLTFHTPEFESSREHHRNQTESFDRSLRQRTNFFFQRDESLVTIWIDQAALRNSYWQNPTNSKLRSLVENPIKRITSLFK